MLYKESSAYLNFSSLLDHRHTVYIAVYRKDILVKINERRQSEVKRNQ